VDSSRNAIDNEQLIALGNIIAAGTNDHVLPSELAEANTAETNALAQQALDATFETNIDTPQPLDLRNATLDNITGRQSQLTARQAQITTRDAELDVTLVTRVTPKSFYDSRFFWIDKRANLGPGSFALQLEAGNAITQTNAQIAKNEETIDETNRLLSQIQHSTDAFIALQIDLAHTTSAFLAV
jgi:hypothetical protein